MIYLFPQRGSRCGLEPSETFSTTRRSIMAWLAVFFLTIAFAITLAIRPVRATTEKALCELSPNERVIAAMMENSPSQNRPELVCHPILHRVARERAQDMANRSYFFHTNPDGYGPNYLIRDAGYQLPGWWGNEPTANYVESIAAGYPSALTAWVAWMRSPSHRTHLLADDPFYTEQLNYGIGFVDAPGSEYGSYYVVLTAPLELELDAEVDIVQAQTSGS